jgi:nucleotide-binding universal stress UspA family protein
MGDGILVEPQYRDVLVCVDGSKESWLALEHAVAAAHAFDARLTLLTVVPETPALIGPAPISREQLVNEVQREMYGALARARDAVPADVSVRTLMKTGDAPARIVETADELGCDAIFLGTRGRGRIGALLGSVSHAVLHRARVSVIVVRAPGDADA